MKDDAVKELQFALECKRCHHRCNVKVYKRSTGVLEASGYACKKGLKYANLEANRKRHAIVYKLKVQGSKKRLKLGLSRKVTDEQAPLVMKLISELKLEAPIKKKQVLIKNIAGTKANLIALHSAKLSKDSKKLCKKLSKKKARKELKAS